MDSKHGVGSLASIICGVSDSTTESGGGFDNGGWWIEGEREGWPQWSRVEREGEREGGGRGRGGEGEGGLATVE